MKKMMIASAIAMTMVSGSAMAYQSELQFFGTVTSKTCDLVLSSSNGGSVSNLIQLGDVQGKDDEGNAKDILLKPAVAGSCDSASITKASITWGSSAMGEKGIGNSSAEGANDAYVKLIAKDSGGNTAAHKNPINKNNNTVDFSISSIDDGVAFSASLVGGTQTGVFQSVAAYSVSYE